MTNKILFNILFLLVFGLAAIAQEVPTKSWDIQKIKGARQILYPSYTGFPYLTDTWILGKIELEDGAIIDSLHLRYSSFKDELIYYNKEAGAQIIIDKISLKSFVLSYTNGSTHVFRKFYFDNFEKGYRYFEILSDGATKLLAYRKVRLDPSTPYKDGTGILRNMVYNPNYSFYFYSLQKEYTSVRMNKISLLAKFNKASQKPIKKLLRKNRIRVSDEESFTEAWKMIEKEGYKVVF